MLACATLCASLTASSFVVAQLVCAISFKVGDDLGLDSVLLLALQTESCGSPRETDAERSAGAARALADAPLGPPSERLWAVRRDHSS